MKDITFLGVFDLNWYGNGTTVCSGHRTSLANSTVAPLSPNPLSHLMPPELRTKPVPTVFEPRSEVCYSSTISVDCNFDSQSLCGFTQDTGDNFNWSLHKGRTGSYPTTGPTTDFSGNGKTNHLIIISTFHYFRYST